MIFEQSKPINSLHGKLAILIAKEISNATLHAGLSKDLSNTVFDCMTDMLLMTKSEDELLDILKSLIGEVTQW